MKKKLNTETIANELEGASLFFTKPHSPARPIEAELVVPVETKTNDSPTLATPYKAQKVKAKTQKEKRVVDQSIDQSTNQSTDQSTSTQLSEIDLLGPIVDRPKAFYITERVNQWLDEAVLYLQSKGLHKVDRSILLNALIHEPKLFEKEALDLIRNKLLLHMTNRSLKRR